MEKDQGGERIQDQVQEDEEGGRQEVPYLPQAGEPGAVLSSTEPKKFHGGQYEGLI